LCLACPPYGVSGESFGVRVQRHTYTRSALYNFCLMPRISALCLASLEVAHGDI
jgi:hypothetical protein